MDAQQIGESIAKAVSREYKGVDVDFGEVIGRREDGSVSVSVGGGVVAARAMASFDVGAAVGKQVMLVEKGGVVTIMGTMADVDNSHAFTDAVDKINAANAAIDGIQADIDSVESQLSGVQAAADAAQSAADVAGQAADQAKDAAQTAKEAADAAASKADAAQADIDSVTVTVSGLSGDLSELTTTVSGVSSTATEALSAASSAQQDIDGFKTTVSQTYETKADADAAMAQEVLDRNSAIEQSASSILSTVSQTYVDKATGETYATKTEVQQTADSIEQTVAQTYQPKGDYLTESDASSTYATKSQLTQTAESITSTVEQTYQPKGDYATSEDVSDAIAQEVIDRNSAISQSATSITSQVSQTYLSKTDAQAGYQPKGDYATGTELDEAIADEVASRNSAIEQSASSILSTVSQNYVNKTTGATYATKTEVEQTADGITQTVAETYLSKDDAGKTYASKTELTQTADGLQVSITEAATAAGTAQTTAESAQSAAGAAQSAADSAQSMAQSAASNADTAKTLATSAQQGVNTVQTYFDFDSDGLHVGKRATSAAGDTYETAETLMGSDGTFGVYDADGNLLAIVRPNGFVFGSGRFGIGYNANSPNIMQIYSLTDGDDIKVYTDNDGQVMVYCNDDQPQYHGAMIVQRQYAGLFTGDGESDAAGSGAYAIVQTSDGVGYVGIYGDDLRIGQKSGASASVPMSQVSSRLSGDATRQYLTGGVTLMTHPCGAVCLAVNAVAFPALAQWGTHSMGTVPAAYRPPVQVGCMGYFATSDGQVLGTVVVGTNGAVTFTAYNACSAGQVTCNLSWCV